MSSIPTASIGNGRKLRADAAASYLHMVADGMPDGHVDAALRTMDEQRYLYNLYKAGRGNLAAYPNANAPHIRGIALDFHTSTAARRGAQLWLTKGGDWSKRVAGEKIRSHEYGWVRTVASERWHYEYQPAKDRHAAADLKARLKKLGWAHVKALQKGNGLTADGIAGPKTWAVLLGKPKAAPKPTTPPKPKTVDVRVSTFNTLDPRFAGKLTAARIKGLCAAVVDAKADVYLLTEAPEQIRNHLRGACSCKASAHVRLPGGAKRWLVRVYRSVAILRDSTKWRSAKTATQVPMGTAYHGALYETLTHTSGQKVTFGVYHLPPDKSASKAGQQKLLTGFLGRLSSGVRIVGGDGANSAAWLAGWADARTTAAESATRNAATYDGGGTPDRIGSKGSVAWRGYTVRPATASDHNLVVTAATIA